MCSSNIKEGKGKLLWACDTALFLRATEAICPFHTHFWGCAFDTVPLWVLRTYNSLTNRVEWKGYYVTSKNSLHKRYSFHLALSSRMLKIGIQSPYYKEAQGTDRSHTRAFWLKIPANVSANSQHQPSNIWESEPSDDSSPQPASCSSRSQMQPTPDWSLPKLWAQEQNKCCACFKPQALG